MHTECTECTQSTQGKRNVTAWHKQTPRSYVAHSDNTRSLHIPFVSWQHLLVTPQNIPRSRRRTHTRSRAIANLLWTISCCASYLKDAANKTNYLMQQVYMHGRKQGEAITPTKSGRPHSCCALSDDLKRISFFLDGLACR